MSGDLPFPELETPRLRLRGLRPGDEEFLASLDSDPIVMMHIHEGPLPYEKALRYARAQIDMASYRSHWGKWVMELREDATSIGWVELGRLSGPERDDLQLGYELAPAYWGQGYATEAATRLLEYAFETLDLDRVAALARPANVASVRVLDKLGFRCVGSRKDEGRVWCNEYRLAVEEWRRR